MKKYLLLGLAVLIGTNLVALSGVAYNRMGDVTSQLTLTERELSLAYNSAAPKENSSMSLTINWRTPTGENESYYPYNSREISLSKDELLSLGFTQIDNKDNYWAETRELYWAFEFDGALHKVEIKKALDKYQAAITTFEEQPNDTNKRKKTESSENLEREKIANSRLFFIEASADYASLANKFSGQRNILIVKGLANFYYKSHDQTYSLMLRHLLVNHIMVVLEHIDVFSGFERRSRRDIASPRFAANIKWGSRLEPWIVDVKRFTD